MEHSQPTNDLSPQKIDYPLLSNSPNDNSYSAEGRTLIEFPLPTVEFLTDFPCDRPCEDNHRCYEFMHIDDISYLIDSVSQQSPQSFGSYILLASYVWGFLSSALTLNLRTLK